MESSSLMDAAALRAFLLCGCNRLGAEQEAVNAMNVFPVPDGDTGINMYLTVNSAGKKIDAFDCSLGVGKLAQVFAQGTLMGARGNSGVILSQMFRGFAASLNGKMEVGPAELAAAMQRGVELSYKSVMKPVEGTILTVYRHFAAAAEKAAQSGADLPAMMDAALAEGEKSLANTPNILPVLKEAGVVDAGGKGLLVFMYGARDSLTATAAEAHLEVVNDAAATPVAAAAREDISTADIEFTYCTQLLIQGENMPIDTIREHLSQTPPGDSLLVVGDETVIKIHFHNNHPGQVLEYCAQFGSLHDIIIDNMRDQHHENVAAAAPNGASAALNGAAAVKEAAPAVQSAPAEHCAVIAVCAGDAMADIYHELGAEVICGGQTMNPSAEDILIAVNANPSPEIVLLPNNSNIILTAAQVKKLAKKKVQVVQSKFVTQGLTAMLGFDPSAGAKENAAAMDESCAAMINGELTYAVRDTAFNGFDIKQGDLLALMQGEIVACGSELDDTLLQLVEKMCAANEDATLISLYYGNNLSEDEAQQLADKIGQRFSDYDLELHNGGQPLYYFLVSVE